MSYIGIDSSSGSFILTSLSLNSNILSYVDENNNTTNIDLSAYLDEDARAIASGTLNGATGIVTFTRDDSSTFTLDLSQLLDDTNIVTSVAGKTGNVTLVKADITDFVESDYEPADATILKNADIGVTVQAYDATILNSADIGVTVQAAGSYEPADATILKDADIGSTVQGYDVNTVIDSAYVHTDNNYTSAEVSKLAGIEDSATADQTAQEIVTLIDADTVAEAGLKTSLGLDTAAYTSSTDYATAAQGTLADSSIQPNDNVSTLVNDAGYLTSFTETNDLTAAVVWANVPDTNITQSSVTQHQAALSITESQISDLGSYQPAGSYVTTTADQALASNTALTILGDTLTLTKGDGTTDTVDLSVYLDEDARAIASGTLASATGIVTFTRDDASTFTLDLSALLDDTNLVTSVAGKAGVVTLTKADITDFVEGDYEPADATILKDADIGVTVQGYNADTVVDSAYVHTDNNYTSAEVAKLAAIESNATADQTAQEIATAIDADTGAEATLRSALGLDTAAYTASSSYATAAQGLLANSAVQPGDNVSDLLNDASYATTSYVDTAESDAVTSANNYTDTRETAITTAYQSYADTAESDAITSANSNTDTLIGDATVTGTVGNTITDRIATAEANANSYTDTAVSNLVDAAPGTLDTLNELAAALGDDPNFATTITASIGTKAAKTTTVSAGTALTGGGDLSADRTINHADVTRSNTTDSGTLSHSGTFTAITGLTSNAQGHVTGAETTTYTLPAGAVPNNATITVAAGTDLATGGDFTTDQGTNKTITVNHADITRTDTTSTDAPGYGGTFEAVTSVTTNARGHVTAIDVSTVTIPASDNTDTNTTYDISASTETGGAGLVLTAGGDGSGTDTVIFSGSQGITISQTDVNNISIQGPDLSSYLTSYTESNDLSTAVTWANVPDANITQSSVTQHQAALSITESQISDLQSYLTSETTTTLSLANNTLTYTDETGTANNIDLSSFLDEDSRAIASGVLNSVTGIVTFTRDDASTFTLDLGDLLDDTNLVTSVNGAAGVVVLTADDIADGTTNAIPTLTQESNWDTAYGWGDHSTVGYLEEGFSVTAGTMATANVTTVDLGNWTITESNGALLFAAGGVNKMKIDASGNLQVVGNVESNATL